MGSPHSKLSDVAPGVADAQHHPRAAAAASSGAPWSELLNWACHGWEERPAELPVAVRDMGPGRGRALVAQRDMAPGEVLLSVPLTRVFASEAARTELEAIGCGWEDFLWAVQVFHSRCFVEPGSGRHLCVPGVDMANHAAQPNAAVRILNSPGACQGYDALEEVAEPAPRQPCRFNLEAGEAGVRQGEEVTISYGRWPSEAFLLLFGFVPAASSSGGEVGGECLVPGECLTLFGDAEEAVRWCLAAAASGWSGGAVPEEAIEESITAVDAAMPGEDMSNLFITAEGVDGRLQCILSILKLPTTELLAKRVRERLAQHHEPAASNEEPVKVFLASKRSLGQLILRALQQ
ncbi:hypothetical protein GPECTOR_10g1032 [Gonium pectorale]|uniref:SET domain-containing protein n=1 Tax=Gonium pectorale TaxID=33097 RepID=A0A150GRR4_GONPE|nr:hypothetical protein GPECTOR_10g1032 [Gonium pectorale]|eukprot:KXZ52010.1 hypothetical protein GPECTOR_10g1032 [Gonium pectorale]